MLSSSRAEENNLRDFLSEYLGILLGVVLGLAITEAIGAVWAADAFSGKELTFAVEARCRDSWIPYYNKAGLPREDRFSWANPDKIRASYGREVEGLDIAAQIAPIPRGCSPPQDEGCVLAEGSDPKDFEGCEPSYYVTDADLREGLKADLTCLKHVRWFQSFAVLFFLVVQAWHVWRGIQTVKGYVLTTELWGWLGPLLGYSVAGFSIGSFAKPLILHGSLAIPLVLFLFGWLLFDITTYALARRNGTVKTKRIWIITDVVMFLAVMICLNVTGDEEANLDEFMREKLHEGMILLALAIIGFCVFVYEVRTAQRWLRPVA